MRVRKPKYVKVLQKEDPPKRKRLHYIRKYKNGGVNLDTDYLRHNPEIKNNRFMSFSKSSITGEISDYLYVGNKWWCRLITKPRKIYQFARFHCFTNDKEQKDLGLWDRKHGLEDTKSIIVYKEDRKGCILDYNDCEIWILWEKENKMELFKSLKGIRFEFFQDKQKFRSWPSSL